MKTELELPCPRGPSGQHEGYWINQETGSFRCYHCGCQYHLTEMDDSQRPPLANIEHWIERDL